MPIPDLFKTTVNDPAEAARTARRELINAALVHESVGTRTEPFGGPTYSPTIAWDSGLPSSAIRFNTLHPIIASRF